MVRIRVPATTANMGPGFDVLGLALSLYNIYEFKEDPNSVLDDKNMIHRAYKYTFQAMGKDVVNAEITVEAEIPSSRGLGSSAACIAAGIMGANSIMGNTLGKEDILNIATQLEGHPDNVAPAIYGGLMISVMDEDGIVTNRLELSDDLRFIALVPEFQLSTAEARAVLPREIPLKDAVYNAGRVSILISALATGRDDLIFQGLKDRIHQPYRGVLIPDFDRIIEISRKFGALGSYLSGAGSTIMCIVKGDPGRFLSDMEKYLSRLPNNWRAIPLQPDYEGTVEL
jgi:homoserine kinase